MRFVHLFIILSAITIISCKSRGSRNVNSHVKTGDFYPERSLLALPAGVPIKICNKLEGASSNAHGAVELIKGAISDWASTIDMKTSSNLNESCDVGASPSAIITIRYSGLNDPSTDICVNYGAGNTAVRNINVAWAVSKDSYNHEIVLCDPNAQVEKDVIWHEVGHLFGNCDQYKIETGNSFASQRLQHPYCGTRFGSQKGECSAMNATGLDHPKAVTRADCEIMQEMRSSLDGGKSGSKVTFRARCSRYPDNEACGLTSNATSSSFPTDMPQSNESTEPQSGPCPKGYYYAVDGWCYLRQ